MDRECEHDVQNERGCECRHQRMSGDDLLVEEVVEDVAERAGEHGDRANRHDRGKATVATRRLAVTAGPEAGEREDERRHAERPERDEVDHDAPHEAEDGARNRAAKEREGDHDDEEEIGRAARDHERRHDDDLQQRGDEDRHRCSKPCRRRHRGRPVGTSTRTASSAPKSTYGSTCTCWKRSVSVWPTLVTFPIGIPFG